MEQILKELLTLINNYKLLSVSSIGLVFLCFIINKGYSTWLVCKLLKERGIKSGKVSKDGSFEFTKE